MTKPKPWQKLTKNMKTLLTQTPQRPKMELEQRISRRPAEKLEQRISRTPAPLTLTPVVPSEIYEKMTPIGQQGVTVGKMPLKTSNTPNVPFETYKKMSPQKQRGVTATWPKKR